MALGSDVINVAISQLGYRESGNNNTKYGAAFGCNNNPWCVMFVWWCFREAGASDLFPSTASCGTVLNKLRNQEYSDWHQAQPGDIILFTNAYRTSDHEHIGIIEYVSASGIHTIEGNTSDMVARRSYNWGSWRVTHIFKIPYDGVSAGFGPMYQEDPENLYKLGNVFLPLENHSYKGQRAIGHDNSRCVQIKMLQPLTKKVVRITKVAQVSEANRLRYLTKRLRLVCEGESQRILKSTFDLPSERKYDFNIFKEGVFKIDLMFSVYRPLDNGGAVNLISNMSSYSDCGWGVEITPQNKIRFYQTFRNIAVQGSQKSTSSITWQARIITSTAEYEKYNSPGSYYVMGSTWYHLIISKPKNSNEFTLELNDIKYPTQTLNLRSEKWSQQDVSSASRRSFKLGALSKTNDPMVFFADKVSLVGSRNNDKNEQTFLSSLNYTFASDNTTLPGGVDVINETSNTIL